MNEVRRRPGVDDDIFDEAAYLAERSEDAALRPVTFTGGEDEKS